MLFSRLFFGVIIYFLFLDTLHQKVEGSLINLSDRLVQVTVDEKEVSFICKIEPFQHNKCHRWYRETESGSIEMLVDGSVEYYPEEEVTPGHIYIPTEKGDYRTPNSTCRDNSNSDSYTEANLTAFYTQESSDEDISHLNDVPQNSAKYFALRNDTFYILTITDLKSTDEGRYFCQYACEYCDSLRTQLQFMIPVTQESITLISSPDIEFVDIGQVVSLTCTVTSRPEAVVRWILVLNHQMVPHIEETAHVDVTYENTTDLYTVKTEFHFRGGHVTSNPMRIYCQVLSPVLATAIIDHSVPDLIQNETSQPHSHNHKKRKRDATTKNGSDGHSTSDSSSGTSLGYLYYAFESVLESHSSEVPIDYQYLTTAVFKRCLYKQPTTALDGRWRLALIIISSFVLLLPIAIGLLQILCNKSSGVSYSLLGDDSIHDYYRIAEAKSHTLTDTASSEQANPVNNL